MLPALLKPFGPLLLGVLMALDSNGLGLGLLFGLAAMLMMFTLGVMPVGWHEGLLGVESGLARVVARDGLLGSSTVLGSLGYWLSHKL